MILLLGTYFVFLPGSPNVRAAQPIGIVCLAEISSSKCPSAGPVFNGPVSIPPTQLKVAVFINSSDSLNGFEIILKSDHTILKPADADVTGTVLLGSATVVLKCVGGVNETSSPCSPSDNADTLHMVAFGGFGLVTSSPTTGLLFTAVYNVSGTTGTTAPLGFQTGCSVSSVGSSSVCVAIVNGLPPPNSVDPETVQSASFDNAAPPSWVSISSSMNMIGPLTPGVHGTTTITTTGQTGWPGINLDSISFTHRETTGLSVIFPTSCGSTATCSAVLDITAASEGFYSVTVFGEYSTYDPNTGINNRLVATLTLAVQVDAFTIQLSPLNMSFVSGSSQSATVTIVFGSGFTGPVQLTTSVSPTGELTVSCSANSLTPSSTSSICTLHSSTPKKYDLTITGASGSFSHSANATVNVLPLAFPPPNQTGIFGLQPVQFWGLVGAILVASLLSFLFFRRRGKRSGFSRV